MDWFEVAPHGALVATIRNDSIVVYDWDGDVVLHKTEKAHLGRPALTWSVDGTRLATSGQDGVIRVWDVATWSVAVELEGHGSRVGALVWSPDGRWLATTSNDLVVRIWDCTTWRCDRVLRRETLLPGSHQFTPPQSLAWNPSSSVLAASSAWTADVVAWDVMTGAEVFRVGGHVMPLYALAWSPNGRRLATGGANRRVKVWDVSSLQDPAEMIALDGHASSVMRLSWSSDSRTLLSSGYDGTKVWHAAVPDD